MITLSRRKTMLVILFLLLSLVAIKNFNNKNTPAFSGNITKHIILDAGHKALFLCFKISNEL